MVLGKITVPGFLLILIIERQESIALAVGAVFFLTFFSLVYHFSFSLSLGDGSI